MDNKGLSPGRCAGPVVIMLLSEKNGLHKKTCVTKCYYGIYIWNIEKEWIFNVSEQRLCDQVRQIKKGWLSQLQLEKINRKVEEEQL